MSEQSRIEELENALEALLECFDRSGEGRPWIEVEVEGSLDKAKEFENGVLVVLEGQVNQTTADAIAIAEEVLYQDETIWGGDESCE